MCTLEHTHALSFAEKLRRFRLVGTRTDHTKEFGDIFIAGIHTTAVHFPSASACHDRFTSGSGSGFRSDFGTDGIKIFLLVFFRSCMESVCVEEFRAHIEFGSALSMTIEAGCDDGNDDFVAKFFVNACAEDDVCTAVDDVLNKFGRFRDFRKRNIKTAGNVDDDAG